MEDQYVHPANGAEFRRQDANLISQNAGLADDRILFELLRPAPGSATPTKGIVPYGKSGWRKETGLNSTALVQGNASNGSIRVMPFRAIIGSTDTSTQLEKLRGGRSGYLVGASTQYVDVALVANASGNPRIDLVYAVVEPDADGDTADYVLKDPNPPHALSIVLGATVTKQTKVSVSKVTGVTGASPALPLLPSDGGGLYYIPLCYVWVPTGFTAASAVTNTAITEVAPCLPIHSSTGVAACMPANQQWVEGGTVSGHQTVGTDRRKQNGAYLPSTMQGKEERLIMLQLGLAPQSHYDGDVVDDSIDWRFRYFQWRVHYTNGGGTTNAFASDRNNTPSAGGMLTTHTTTELGVGQSFYDDNADTITVGDGIGTAVYTDFGSGATVEVMLYVRNTDGALVVKLTGPPTKQVFVWLEATAPYSNYGLLP